MALEWYNRLAAAYKFHPDTCTLIDSMLNPIRSLLAALYNRLLAAVLCLNRLIYTCTYRNPTTVQTDSLRAVMYSHLAEAYMFRLRTYSLFDSMFRSCIRLAAEYKLMAAACMFRLRNIRRGIRLQDTGQ